MILKIPEDTARKCLHISWYRYILLWRTTAITLFNHDIPTCHPSPSYLPISIIDVNSLCKPGVSLSPSKRGENDQWKQMRYRTDVPLINRGETVWRVRLPYLFRKCVPVTSRDFSATDRISRDFKSLLEMMALLEDLDGFNSDVGWWMWMWTSIGSWMAYRKYREWLVYTPEN